MNPILKKVIPLVEFLGIAFGPHCEIVLQDVEEQKIISIANSHVSSRENSAPLTDFALKIIADDVWKTKDYICNYSGKTSTGKPIACSTYFIKEDGQLIGMLCVNIDITPYKDLCNQVFALTGLSASSFSDISNEQVKDTKHIETLSVSIKDITNQAISSVFSGQRISPSRMTQEEKTDIVRHLNNNGIFQLKGAISEVAKSLDCSDATVYRYLSRINNE